MACWTSFGPPYLGLSGEALWVDAAALPLPRPSPYAYAAAPIPTRPATIVDVGRAEETPLRVFEDTERLPMSLAGFKVLIKAGRNMFGVQNGWMMVGR